jgi:hypothetical protein
VLFLGGRSTEAGNKLIQGVRFYLYLFLLLYVLFLFIRPLKVNDLVVRNTVWKTYMEIGNSSSSSSQGKK